MPATGQPDSDGRPSFGAELRQCRTDRGWSLRDLACRITFHRGYIGKIETGEKFPERQFAELADRELQAHGQLVCAWHTEAEERRQLERTGRLLTASVKDSLRLITAMDEKIPLEDIDEAVQALAVEYLRTPPGPMLQKAVELRSELLRRLKEQDYRPHQLPDLYVALGRLQGVLAYAALDLGDPQAAMTHADAAWACADQVGDNELRAWVRGTQSLIARFRSDFTDALWYVHNGLEYPSPGTSRIRLLSGVAQCQANLDDSHGANQALDQAQTEREQLAARDSVQGLFTFSEAKQRYYAGSSLIWLNERADAERAAAEASLAITMWEQGPPEDRSLDDEALARVYLATAQLQLHDLEAAKAAVRPILDLPAERQISWIKKRLDRLAGMLLEEPYKGSLAAKEMYDEIHSLA